MPDEIKRERRARFMELAAELSAARLAAKVGRTLRVLVDRLEDGIAIARTAGDAPEIDGVVRVVSARGAQPLKIGEFADVNIVAAGAYDLEARALESM